MNDSHRKQQKGLLQLSLSEYRLFSYFYLHSIKIQIINQLKQDSRSCTGLTVALI
jgi:hypothetical protein